MELGKVTSLSTITVNTVHALNWLAVGYALNPPYEEVGCVNEM
ncbi:protein of unknown function [Limnospira indica PCC 8005]|uniref:Uncharacterized protein n=1 Tax=Limnospira indica PCC 8005 TaxID=376219 RepID=A0A9P1KI36_9CYAN|nr:protein of unknown function [Limnospira indica PCC 8005]